MKNIHYGQVIERIIRRNGYSITEIARLTNVNRRSVYNWFDQPRLKDSIILSIGRAINFDFTTMIPGLIFDPMIDSAGNTVVQQAQKNTEAYWKDKYVSLLEKYSELLTLAAEREVEPDYKNWMLPAGTPDLV